MAELDKMLLCVLLLSGVGLLQVMAQVPAECAEQTALTARQCCPDAANGEVCGGPTRGECVPVESICKTDYEPVIDGRNFSDYRSNWPSRIFDNLCRCKDNYGGYDCGECKFGYEGDDCQQKENYVRRSVTKLSDAEWANYREQLRISKTSDSRYKVYIGGDANNATNYETVSIYNLFIWMHHYVARGNDGSYDKDGSAYDYAHDSVGFLTWHRVYLLWFEREMRLLLNDDTFALRYWEWTNEAARETEKIFVNDKLGGYDENGIVVDDDLFGSSTWTPVCWYTKDVRETYKVCDVNDGIDKQVNNRIVRCPDNTACMPSNSDWPDEEEVNAAAGFDEYYGTYLNKFDLSFSNFLEGFDSRPNNTCNDDSQETRLCGSEDEPVRRRLHNSVHIIVGLGGFPDAACEEPDMFNETGVCKFEGTMADVAASPNDPVFLNHHTMIDCLFQQQLDRYGKARSDLYPKEDDVDAAHAGHGPNDCIVPFIPLYTHIDVFDLDSTDFGYSCDLPDFPGPKPDSDGAFNTGASLVVLILMACVGLFTLVFEL